MVISFLSFQEHNLLSSRYLGCVAGSVMAINELQSVPRQWWPSAGSTKANDRIQDYKGGSEREGEIGKCSL